MRNLKEEWIGETWTIHIEENKKVFVKIGYLIGHKERMKISSEAINYMRSNDIKNINKIIKTTEGASYISFNDGILIVFEYLEGKIDFGISYTKVIKNLIKIYKIGKTDKIPEENFEVENLIETLYKTIENAENNNELLEKINRYKNIIENDILNFKRVRNKIDTNVNKYITHGDASVNVLETNKGEYLIDWDDALVAPIERDAWVFMNFEEKIDDINNMLKENEINYIISKELLVFYAYKSYIIYLIDTIEKYLKLKDEELLNEIDEFFTGWVRQRIDSKIAIKVLN